MEHFNQALQQTMTRREAPPQPGTNREALSEALPNPAGRLSRRIGAGAVIPEERTLKRLIEDYERQVILTALDLSGWSQRRVAASLGVLPSTLSEKMKRLGLRWSRHHPAVSDAAAPAVHDEGS
jgi:DNA-binding NtrC family response regulator